MAKLTVEIITGERVVLKQEDVDLVTIPGVEGELGILPGHAKLITLLSHGEMRIRHQGEDDFFAVFGGFLEVTNNKVIVLADTAERASEIDIQRAALARENAETALRYRDAVVDLAEAEAALQRAAIRERIGQRRRGRASASSGNP
jgi:F-type H+-transporting ATPase subunit epsilon